MAQKLQTKIVRAYPRPSILLREAETFNFNLSKRLLSAPYLSVKYGALYMGILRIHW